MSSKQKLSTRPRMALIRCRDVYELPVRREAEAFAEAGYRVDVVMLAGREGEAGVTSENGITVHRLAGSKSRGSKLQYLTGYGGFMMRVFRFLAREHRGGPFDLIQVNTMPDFMVLATLLARLRGATISVFFKEPTPELGLTLFESDLVRRVLTLSEKLAITYADVAFTVTPELRQTYIERGADGDKVHVVLNCPDIRHLEESQLEPHREPEHLVLVCHGTIEHRYGHDVMIDAIDIVRRKIPNVKLRVLGDGDHVPAMLERIDQLGLADHVSYLGWLDIDQVVAEVAGADAGIVAQLASPYSNLVHTNKMFEYIMLGVPCIASRLESVSSAFTDDEILFYEPDSAEAMAEAIIRLHDEPELGDRLTTNARERYDSGYRWADQSQVLIEASTAAIKR